MDRSCLFLEIPVEIMEMILSDVNIQDLENLLKASPVIKVTAYSEQVFDNRRFLTRHAMVRNGMSSLVMKKMFSHISWEK
jgi:hypothetical protein